MISSHFYVLSHSIKRIRAKIPALSLFSGPQLSKDIAEHYLMQLPIFTHPQLSALSLFRLCCRFSLLEQSHHSHQQTSTGLIKRQTKNHFLHLMWSSVFSRDCSEDCRPEDDCASEIAKLSDLWKYALTSHQIPPVTSLSEFLLCLKPLCPLFIRIEDPISLFSWQLLEAQHNNTLTAKGVLHNLRIRWQPWTTPELQQELLSALNKYPFFKEVTCFRDLSNIKFYNTVKLQFKWKSLIQLVPIYFISVESLKNRLLSQNFNSIQNVTCQFNHEKCRCTALQWQDFTEQSPFFYALEWSFDRNSLRLRFPATCTKVGFELNSCPGDHTSVITNADQTLSRSTLLRQCKALFYAALKLICYTVPTFFIPLDIIQRQYALQSSIFFENLRNHFTLSDVDSSPLTAEEAQWLKCHFSYVEPLLDHPDLRFAVELSGTAGSTTTDQPTRFQTRLPLSGALVRLHPEFFHRSRGEADSYFIYRFCSFPLTTPSKSGVQCSFDTPWPMPRWSYKVQFHGINSSPPFAPMEPIHELLSQSPLQPSPPCVIFSVSSTSGVSPAAPVFHVNQNKDSSKPMTLMLALCGKIPLPSVLPQAHHNKSLNEKLLLGVVHVFSFSISDSSTEWWRDISSPVLDLLKSERVIKLFLTGSIEPIVPCSSHMQDESFITGLLWPPSFGVFGDLNMLTQFTGYPIDSSVFSAALLTPLLMRRLNLSLHCVDSETQLLNPIVKIIVEAAAVAHALLFSAQKDIHGFHLLYRCPASDLSAQNATVSQDSFYKLWSSFTQGGSSYHIDYALTLRLYRYLQHWFPLFFKNRDFATQTTRYFLREELIECIKMPIRIFSIPMRRKKELLKEISFLYGPEPLPQLLAVDTPEEALKVTSTSGKEGSPAFMSCKTNVAYDLPFIFDMHKKAEYDNICKADWDYIEALESDAVRVLGNEKGHTNLVKDNLCIKHDKVNYDSIGLGTECAISSSSMQSVGNDDSFSVLPTPPCQPPPLEASTSRPLEFPSL